MLPADIEYIKEGEFISAEHYNKLVSVCRSLIKGEGRNGITIKFADAGIVWRGSGTGSDASGSTSSGSAVNFRGHWNGSTTYSEGDVVFTAGVSYQQELEANTYVSLVDNNLNHQPPAITASYEDSYWRVVAIGSWPNFVVANPTVAPSDERYVSIAPGAGEFYISGSSETEAGGTFDTTDIIGGTVTVGKSVYVYTGPVTIEFADGTKVIFDYADIQNTDMAGREFRLREIDVCDDGVQRKMGILATEVYD